VSDELFFVVLVSLIIGFIFGYLVSSMNNTTDSFTKRREMQLDAEYRIAFYKLHGIWPEDVSGIKFK
jgi:hypothetical protein